MYPAAIAITVALVVATLAISYAAARRFTRTTAEFYLAGRAVNVVTNAAAICGDYFSAASFLGVAAAVYAFGMDGIWYGVGFAAGFVPVLLFFASPIRRFGEYTLPDFLAARFQSHAARLAGVAMVQVIAICYLVPQMMGAGTVWELLIGRGLPGLSAYATGVLVTAAVMVVYTAVGGMRGTTWNQAVQFAVLVTAVALVAALGLRTGFRYHQALAAVSQGPLVAPQEWRVADLLRPDPVTGRAPVDMARAVMRPAYWDAHVAPRLADPEARVWVLMPLPNRLRPGDPVAFNRPGSQYSLPDQVSLALTLILGTAGLPHVMNRYYTNISGPVARWSTVYVLAFAGAFYLLAAMVGVMGRALLPELPAVPTALPAQAVDGVLVHADVLLPLLAYHLGGPLALGYVVAGAFAAMFSTVAGLLMASAASWGHDLYEQYINPRAPEWQRVAVGKGAVVAMAVVAAGAGLAVPRLQLARAYPELIALMVTWAFAVAASGFVPVLFCSIWWRGTTLKGALAGMLVGGGGAVVHIALTVLRVRGTLPPGGVWAALASLQFPSLLTVPLAFFAILAVSWLDRRHVPRNIEAIWLRIHGTAAERRTCL